MNQTEETSRVALVTGAGRRIGAAIAAGLHQAGFKLLIHYHKSQKEAQALAMMLNQYRPESAYIIQEDLEKPDAAVQLLKTVFTYTDRLDVLVNNASLFEKNKPEEGDAAWDRLFQLNVRLPFLLSQGAYPWLKKQQGVIINITDIHAEKPLKDYSLYCQSKAALLMQTKSLALEFAPEVRVNAVAPGAIAWPEGDNILQDERKKKIVEKTLLKKHGDPVYIAKAVLALVENDYVTGQVWAVDGGRGIK